MSYARKCLCCRRDRQQRHFFMVAEDGGMRMSFVCTDCVNGLTPVKFLPKDEPRIAATDGLWRVARNAAPPIDFMPLGARL